MNWENILRDGTGSRQETGESRIWAPWAMLARPVGSRMRGQPSQSSAVCVTAVLVRLDLLLASGLQPFPARRGRAQTWSSPCQEAAEPGGDAGEDSGGGTSGTRLDRGSAAPCSLRPKRALEPQPASTLEDGGAQQRLAQCSRLGEAGRSAESRVSPPSCFQAFRRTPAYHGDTFHQHTGP